MAYGLSNLAPARNVLTERALDRVKGTWGGYQAWRELDPDSRFALVERALQPANDIIDAYPIAL